MILDISHIGPNSTHSEFESAVLSLAVVFASVVDDDDNDDDDDDVDVSVGLFIGHDIRYCRIRPKNTHSEPESAAISLVAVVVSVVDIPVDLFTSHDIR
jgi:hypothetical protein